MGEKQPPSDGIVSKAHRWTTTVSRYDLVLAVVPVALAVAVALGQLSSVPLHAALAAGSLVAGAAVVDVLFVNPPGRGGHRPRRGAGG